MFNLRQIFERLLKVFRSGTMSLKKIDLHSTDIWNDLDALRVKGKAHVLSVALYQFPQKEAQFAEIYCPNHSGKDGFKPDCSSSLSSLPQRSTSSPALHQNWTRGSIIYQVGSLTKCVIAVAIFRLIKEQTPCDPDYAIELDSPAIPLYYKWFQKRYPQVPITKEHHLETNPHVKSLLRHANGFADLGDIIFAPDGTFVLPEEDFLETAVTFTNTLSDEDRRGGAEYSNANYIFLGLLIELITGKPLALALKLLVFDRLGMNDTSMDPKHLENHRQTHPFAVGHQVASDDTVRTTSFNHLLANSVQSASMGLRSSTRDLTAFARGIFACHFGKSEFLSRNEHQLLFTGQPFTPFGRFSVLDEGLIGSESHVLNLVPTLDAQRLEQKKIGSEVLYPAHHKSGYVDGFSSMFVMLPKQMISIVVLSDSLSSLDTPEVTVRYLLQRMLPQNYLRGAFELASQNQVVVANALAELEAKSSTSKTKGSFPLAKDIAGTYQHQHKHCRQKIIVSKEGTARIYFDENLQSQEMPMVRVNENEVRLLIDQPLSLERWAQWRNIDFIVRESFNGRLLQRGRHEYRLIRE